MTKLTKSEMQGALREGALVAFKSDVWWGSDEATPCHDAFQAVNMFSDDRHPGVTQSCDMRGKEAAWMLLLVSEYAGTEWCAIPS